MTNGWANTWLKDWVKECYECKVSFWVCSFVFLFHKESLSFIRCVKNLSVYKVHNTTGCRVIKNTDLIRSGCIPPCLREMTKNVKCKSYRCKVVPEHVCQTSLESTRHRRTRAYVTPSCIFPDIIARNIYTSAQVQAPERR